MAKSYFSIDIGGTYIKYAKVDRSGNIEQVDKVPTPTTLDDLEAVLAQLVEPVSQEVRGVGISCPGKVDIKTGTVYNGGALPFLHGYSFRKFFETRFNLPCGVSNDGKAAALSEIWLGNLKGIENGVAIVLGTGIGGGIIANGELLQGSHFQAGELSFLMRTPEKMTMENMLGFTGSAVKFIAACAQVLGLPDSDGVAVFEAIKSGKQPEVTKLFESYCHEIAFMILNLQATLDIEKVVIGGGISAQSILIEEITKQYLAMRQSFSFWDNSWSSLAIENCKFLNNANLLGAVYQLLLQFDEEM
ncbi:ROK family protein [Enterococcus sp. LJL120]